MAMRRFERILDRTIDVAAVVAATLLAFQVVAITVEVLARRFFNFSFEAVTSLCSWSLVYIAFLGAAWLQREKGHVRIDLLLTRLRGGARRFFDALAVVLGIICCAILTWFGVKVTWVKYATNADDFFALPEVPIFTIYVVIPFGMLLFLLQLLRDFAELFRARGSATPIRKDATDF